MVRVTMLLHRLDIVLGMGALSTRRPEIYISSSLDKRVFSISVYTNIKNTQRRLY